MKQVHRRLNIIAYVDPSKRPNGGWYWGVSDAGWPVAEGYAPTEAEAWVRAEEARRLYLLKDENPANEGSAEPGSALRDGWNMGL